MVPRGLDDGSFTGTTVIGQQPPPAGQQHSSVQAAARKGILKRTPANPNQESGPVSAGSSGAGAKAATSTATSAATAHHGAFS